MTNSSSTYLGIVGGAAVGAFVSWLIYNRQKKTSDQQDLTLKLIKELQENQMNLLKRLETIDEHHDKTLKSIEHLEKRIADLLEAGKKPR